MPDNFKGKYRIKSLRFPDYDYSREGAYFITICLNDRQQYTLSEIINEELVPNEFTEIVKDIWLDLINHYEGIMLDEYVVMPNHFHGIIMIIDQPVESETIRESSLQEQLLPLKRRNMLLSKIMGRFKMRTAKLINQKLNKTGEPFWQKDYFERIIRDENELNRIREYIYYNPLRWHFEKNNPENMSFL